MADRLLILGGTFNPVHHGHLIIARAAAEHMGIARVLLMPVAVPPHKVGQGADGDAWLPGATAQDRLAMLRLAVAGEELFEVSELELSRPALSYTIDTLLELRRVYGPDAQLHWIIGADMLADLPNWRRAGEVVDLAQMVVAARPPFQDRLESVFQALAARFTAAQVHRLAAGVVPSPVIDISSTQIRQRVGRGQSIRFLTPDPVVNYIREHRLYR